MLAVDEKIKAPLLPDASLSPIIDNVAPVPDAQTPVDRYTLPTAVQSLERQL